PAIASAPFATGLGNEHPLENGFSFLSPYGLPYLPGSGVKGVIRRAAEELASGEWGESEGWEEEIIRALFGPGEEDPTRDNNPQQGALRFWDVFPTPEASAKNDKLLLTVEIMTPHLGKYYQGDASPNTSLTPTPISFLAVAAKSHFSFYVECNPALLPPTQKKNWQTLLQAAFEHAGKWLGFGAKTAVGYGRMALDPKIAKQRAEAAEKRLDEEEKATEQKVQVVFKKHDARCLPFLNEFNLVIMICEGAFSLMETDEMNFQILQNAANALLPKGKLIFTALNGLFPLYHSVKDFLDSNTKEGNAKTASLSFDLMTFREHSTLHVEDDLGNKKELQCNERYYVPSEITWLLRTLNFSTVDIYGAKLGAFSRNDKLSTEDFEMLIIAEKR
nr:type III-B CRISPR module RAMP protein Cmr6 [Syntrophales bacterium]